MKTFKIFMEFTKYKDHVSKKTEEHIKQYFSPNGQAKKIWDSQKDFMKKVVLIEQNPLFGIFLLPTYPIPENTQHKIINFFPDLLRYVEIENWDNPFFIDLVKKYIISDPFNIVPYIRRSNASTLSSEIFNILLQKHPEWIKNAIESIFSMIREDRKSNEILPLELEKILIDKISSQENLSFLRIVKFLSKEAQKHILDKMGAVGITYIDSLENSDPELMKKYGKIIGLKKAGWI